MGDVCLRVTEQLARNSQTKHTNTVAFIPTYTGGRNDSPLHSFVAWPPCTCTGVLKANREEMNKGGTIQ